MNQLEKSLQAAYPSLPWVGARRMRNVIVHDYGHADVSRSIQPSTGICLS
ncbi:MAG: DUF86 domain-containing protein [Bacilli bacterium]|nr:DUF86 domain-containing protein [Bacilli bacterium]